MQVPNADCSLINLASARDFLTLTKSDLLYELKKAGGHSVGVRRLELLAKAKDQPEEVDQGALLEQILAVDAASAEQELDEVPCEVPTEEDARRVLQHLDASLFLHSCQAGL